MEGNLEKLKSIYDAIKSSASSDIYVDYPIILINTNSPEFEMITERNDEGK